MKKIIIIIGSYLITLLIMFFAFVPFNRVGSIINSPTQVQQPTFQNKMGYHSLWYSSDWYGSDGIYHAVIDYKQLSIQILAVTMLYIIIYIVLIIIIPKILLYIRCSKNKINKNKCIKKL